MTATMDIQEGNKIIAAFHGKYTTEAKEWAQTEKHAVSKYEYHSSWDWLLPAWRKFRNEVLPSDLWESKSQPEQHRISVELKRAILDADIKTAHKLFSELIQWYNKKNK